MTTRDERGIALILALFLMMALSVVGASLMFLAQTETYASMNYRVMSQSRYAAEAGIQKAANFLLDFSAPVPQYRLPGTTNPADPMSAYNTAKSPVEYNNQPVVLSNDPAASNYPDPAVKTAFAAAFGPAPAYTGSLHTVGAGQSGNIELTYSATATLISMTQFESLGGTPGVIQTWEVVGKGGFKNTAKATVEVSAIIETPKVPGANYAAFASDPGCGALVFQGNVETNSYDSTNLAPGVVPTYDEDDADVGTNGNLTTGGSVDINGKLYTPRAGVGACTEGNVTALEGNPDDIQNGIVQLPKSVTYPPPTVPPYTTVPEAALSTTLGACALLSGGGTLFDPTNPALCTTSGDDVIIDFTSLAPADRPTLPSLTLTGGTDVYLVAGNPPIQYAFNSLNLASNSELGVRTDDPNKSVIVNVVGKDNTGADIALPIDFTGGTYAATNSCDGCAALCATCSTYDATMLTFVYAGTGEVRMKGHASAAATFYVPNAAVDFGGTSDLFGAIIGGTVTESGSGAIHYDRRLQTELYITGQPMLGTFTWRRF